MNEKKHVELHYEFGAIRAGRYTMSSYMDKTLEKIFNNKDFKDVELTSDQQALLSAIKEIAVDIDNTDNPDILYHNRNHFMEVVAVAYELAQEEFKNLPPSQRMEAVLLAVTGALVHDYGHDGSINSESIYGKTLEELALEKTKKIMQSNGVSYMIWGKVEEMILGTDIGNPQLRASIRENYNNQDNSITAKLVAIVADADILPSILPGTGLVRGVMLKNEWARLAAARQSQNVEDMSRTIANLDSRVGFLKHFELMTNASRILGFEDARLSQILAIESYLKEGNPVEIKNAKDLLKIHNYLAEKIYSEPSKIRSEVELPEVVEGDNGLLTAKPSKFKTLVHIVKKFVNRGVVIEELLVPMNVKSSLFNLDKIRQTEQDVGVRAKPSHTV